MSSIVSSFTDRESGDLGFTSIKGVRMPKASSAVSFLAESDELIGQLGEFKLNYGNRIIENGYLKFLIGDFQHSLYVINAFVGFYEKEKHDSKIKKSQENLSIFINKMEEIIKKIEAKGDINFNRFIVPGENKDSCAVNLIRVKFRKLECEYYKYIRFNNIGFDDELVRKFLNRSSDFFYCIFVLFSDKNKEFF